MYIIYIHICICINFFGVLTFYCSCFLLSALQGFLHLYDSAHLCSNPACGKGNLSANNANNIYMYMYACVSYLCSLYFSYLYVAFMAFNVCRSHSCSSASFCSLLAAAAKCTAVRLLVAFCYTLWFCNHYYSCSLGLYAHK